MSSLLGIILAFVTKHTLLKLCQNLCKNHAFLRSDFVMTTNINDFV